MKLLTKQIRKILPPLYAQENRGGEAIAYIKFFMPDNYCSAWYATEFDGHDIFFGLVVGFGKKLSHFSLKGLERIRGPESFSVERDTSWQPKPLKEIAPDLFINENERN